ncbi:DUF5110 domain-containing protein [Exilibacterium tricleocarpae]|uniref:DUF5110 domain-containing protein n=1 Tax=Exilibacterium tricleocarpae TaxID=2591008 RepID=A0A545TFT2_9GAMM|nr:DUF5110 domain-containing protein [Exilibacterium tricleocarpae]
MNKQADLHTTRGRGITLFILLISTLIAGCHSASEGAFEKTARGDFERLADGVTVIPASGSAKAVHVRVYGDNLIRVTAVAERENRAAESLMVTATTNGQVNFDVSEGDGFISLKTAEILTEISLLDGKVVFKNHDGSVILSEAGQRGFSAVTQDPGVVDADSYALRQAFLRTGDEALYGLGQHQNGQVNLAGENVKLTTHNLVISIPFLVSSRNYGILWDNNSVTHFGDPEPAKPLFESLRLYDAEGKPGGLTARYFDGDKLILSQVKKDLDYQFYARGDLRQVPLPDAVKDISNLRIEWEGSFETDTGGLHRFSMYSSGYAKLSINNQEVLNRWRMNWNPWYHDYAVDLKENRRYPIKLDWTTQDGFMRLLHRDPLSPADSNLTSFSSETGKSVDYYFVKGADIDDVIAGYRKLTGKSVMLPRWAYGFWQSRERYKSQDELLAALKEYRDREIPIDNIVLDWSYWPEDAWGSHEFDKKFFPTPKKMVQQVHEMNAQIMISVWPKFYPDTKNYKELNAGSYMFNKNLDEKNHDWIGKGYLNAFYDAYHPEARKIFWDQLNRNINALGFDAWWLDAVEPDIHSNLSWEKRKDLMTPNHLGTGAEVFNAYALPHAESVYLGDRASTPDTRVFILTRSGFAGIQRTASAIWSGDIVSRWSNLKEQIAAGIGVGLAGVPNWTFDIGGFTPEDRFRWNSDNADATVGHYSELPEGQLDEWQELNTRWFQFGAFVPLFRSHGQNPYREIYNIAAEDSEHYESMVWYTKLRYRLLPYIYSIAGDMYHRDATLMRGLVMDFPEDKVARNIRDQYMFGPSLLVAPVYEMGARERSVYLPAGTDWYDLYTGRKFAGGTNIQAAAPISRMPAFVKSGSIIPSAPAVQYADQIVNAPITLNVYVGSDSKFELYEDDGRSYGYEKGEWSRILFRYSEKSKTLFIGDREGKFPGMAQDRDIMVRWISGETPNASNFDEAIATKINYSGNALSITRP